jgi:flagellar protein FlaJ
MKQFLEVLHLKYEIKREYFTIGIPVIIAALVVIGALAGGLVALPGEQQEVQKSDRQKAYEELVKQIESEGEGTANETVAAEPVAGEADSRKPGPDSLLIIATIIAITPYAIDITLEKRRTRKKEELYTEFLFKLSELMRGGLDPVKSVVELSRTNLGELTPHVRLAATAMSFGKSFEEAMMAMTRTLKSELITRYTMLVVQASYAGGSTSDLILKASEDMRSLLGIEREKEGNLAQYAMIFYFAQGILFFIAVTLTTSLLPYLQDLSTTSFLGMGSAEMADLDFAGGFFHLLMINAFFGGLIIGKICEGEARYGLKHSVILMTAGYIACVFFLLPAGEAPPPGEVRITIISGGGQEGFPGLPLSQPLVVQVTDLEGKPLEKEDVVFSIDPGGSVQPATDRTDAEGLVTTKIILGQEEGTYTITATCQGVGMSTGATAVSSGG